MLIFYLFWYIRVPNLVDSNEEVFLQILIHVIISTLHFFWKVLNHKGILLLYSFFIYFQVSQVFFVIQTNCSKDFFFFGALAKSWTNRVIIIFLPERILRYIVILKRLLLGLFLINLISNWRSGVLNIAIVVSRWIKSFKLFRLLCLNLVYSIYFTLYLRIISIVNICSWSLRFFIHHYYLLKGIGFWIFINQRIMTPPLFYWFYIIY